MGRGVLDVGDSPRLGSVMKLVGNFYIMSMMELIGEGLTLADKNGLQRDAVVHFLKESFQGPITGGKPSLRGHHICRSCAYRVIHASRLPLVMLFPWTQSLKYCTSDS